MARDPSAMMVQLGRVVAERAGGLIALLGAFAAGAAWRWSGTPGGAMWWTLAVVIACIGYGRVLDRVGGSPRSIGMAAICGLACLLLGSTILARLGLLYPMVQLVAISLGIVACAFVTIPQQGLPRVAMFAWVAIGACVSIAMIVCVGDAWLADGINHPMAVKQLWDTGSLGSSAHQVGVQIVGESYIAMIGGPITAGAFDGGLCVVLLLLLLATDLAGREGRVTMALFLLILVPVVMNPEYAVPTARWSGTMFLVALFAALDRTVAEGSGRWRVFLLAAALAAIRHEFALLVAPYVLAAVLFPDGARSRRAVALATVAWGALLVAVHGGLLGALLGLGATAVSLGITFILVRLVSTYSWRSTLSVAIFAAVMMVLGSAFRVIPSESHSRSVLSILLWGTAFGILLLCDRRLLEHTSARPRIRLLAAMGLLVVIVVAMTFGPNFETSRRGRLHARYVDGLTKFQAIRIEGYDLRREQGARWLQDHAPVGASIGFWGKSGSGLDFSRNVIRDISWERGRFLVALGPAQLEGLEYLIVQAIEPPPSAPLRWQPWGELIVHPMTDVAASLRLIATLDSISIYRIAR